MGSCRRWLQAPSRCRHVHNVGRTVGRLTISNESSPASISTFSRFNRNRIVLEIGARTGIYVYSLACSVGQATRKSQAYALWRPWPAAGAHRASIPVHCSVGNIPQAMLPHRNGPSAACRPLQSSTCVAGQLQDTLAPVRSEFPAQT